MEYANVPILKIIRKEVNTFPASDSGRPSPKPTVATVLMVIKKALRKEMETGAFKKLKQPGESDVFS